MARPIMCRNFTLTRSIARERLSFTKPGQFWMQLLADYVHDQWPADTGGLTTEAFPTHVLLGPDLKILDIDQGVQSFDVSGFVNFYMNIIQTSIAADPFYQLFAGLP